MPDQSESTVHEARIDPALEVANRLLGRLIGLVGTIVILGFLLVFGLVATYVYFSINPDNSPGATQSANRVEALLGTIWQQLLPIGNAILRLAAPVLILLMGIVVLAYLGRRGASPLDIRKITGDLPSVLALVIILTICLLPIAGVEVPAALSNIALVVVGFYFGKRDRPEGISPRATSHPGLGDESP